MNRVATALLVGVALLSLGACAGSALPEPDSTHTNSSMLDALAPLGANGLVCEEWVTKNQDTPGVVCSTTEGGSFDPLLMPTIVTEESGDLAEAHALMVKGCDEEAVLGTPVEELYKDAYVVMGSNWVVLSPVPRKADADALARATGGIAYPFLEWCGAPVPLGVEG